MRSYESERLKKAGAGGDADPRYAMTDRRS